MIKTVKSIVGAALLLFLDDLQGRNSTEDYELYIGSINTGRVLITCLSHIFSTDFSPKV